MAEGCQKLFNTDISLSTTGVAGPRKGEDGKEVGTVFTPSELKIRK
jgi:nicotinamide-nucleotide amidase